MPESTVPADLAHRARHIGNPRSDLWLRAIHEAGHAVVCLAAGGSFRAATLRASGHSRFGGSVDGVACPSPLLEAIVSLSGFTAESIADTIGMKAAQKAQKKAPAGTIVLSRAWAGPTVPSAQENGTVAVRARVGRTKAFLSANLTETLPSRPRGPDPFRVSGTLSNAFPSAPAWAGPFPTCESPPALTVLGCFEDGRACTTSLP